MISRSAQRTTKDRPSDRLGTSGATSLFKLSATMVELSLRHKPPDLGTDVPAKAAIKLDCYSPEPTGQLISINRAGTAKEEGCKAAQLHYSEAVTSRRELLRTSISRISDQSVTTFAWLRTRTGFVALALLVLPLVYAVHHQVKSQSQIPAMLQQRQGPLVPSTASQNIHNHAQALPPKKAKPRRHQSDYIAKDTYIYYGKDGKPGN
jgi:hypothetical protein